MNYQFEFMDDLKKMIQNKQNRLQILLLILSEFKQIN